MGTPKHVPNFIDLFAGCGGLSLGLAQAGFRGLFAVEKAKDAFSTFETNLIDGPESLRFAWPKWLAQGPHDISKLIENHSVELQALAGQVDLVVGGPPCQGFSFAGRRIKDDRRNSLFKKYVDLVEMIQPRAVIVENVPGMRVAHGAGTPQIPGGKVRASTSYYDRLVKRLDGIGYEAKGDILRAVNFGVPQQRPRLVVIGLRKDVASRLENPIDAVFEKIESARNDLLAELGLVLPITAAAALSDLSVVGQETLDCLEPGSQKGFRMVNYSSPITRYQKLMHEGMGADKAMDSMRLARHTEKILARFRYILDTYPKGVSLNNAARAELGLSKHRTCPMEGSSPSPTLTTLPDDLLHYEDPRILTVREMARLQSFPDWFKFRGKYTTGGERRKIDCPRYTQVGNAVPPLMARAIGLGVKRLLEAADGSTPRAGSGSTRDHRTSAPSSKQGSPAWVPK